MIQLGNKTRLSLIAMGCAALALAVAIQAHANPGDILVPDVPLPMPLYGVSMAVDCGGNIYYTGIASVSDVPSRLFKMDHNGVLLSTVNLVQGDLNGPPVGIDEIAWDSGRNALWGIEHRTTPLNVYLIDPVSGVATVMFVAGQTPGPGIFRDGIALDGSDDSLWISGDVSTTIEHYSTSGTYLGQITPRDAAGAALGSISGVVAGLSDVLYVGHNPFGAPSQIFEVHKSDGLIIRQFALGGNRVEGLECDSLNFAPGLGLWSREFGTYPTLPSHMDVFELEPGACGCPSATGDDDDDDGFPGRMTGGGSIPLGSKSVTHGFELHCDPASLPNNLEVNWDKPAKKFHLDTLTSVSCSDDPGFSEGQPIAGFDTVIGSGSGRYNGQPGATIDFMFTDEGEPGSNDTAIIKISNAAGVVVLQVTGKLNKGNQQAHPE